MSQEKLKILRLFIKKDKTQNCFLQNILIYYCRRISEFVSKNEQCYIYIYIYKRLGTIYQPSWLSFSFVLYKDISIYFLLNVLKYLRITLGRVLLLIGKFALILPNIFSLQTLNESNWTWAILHWMSIQTWK